MKRCSGPVNRLMLSEVGPAAPDRSTSKTLRAVKLRNATGLERVYGRSMRSDPVGSPMTMFGFSLSFSLFTFF